MNKKDLQQTIETALNIVEGNHALDSALSAQFQKIGDEIEQFNAKILVVGGFSAGKSAMLNTFLGTEEILPENISPETAIATELRYGIDEKILCIQDGGDVVFCNFDEVREKSVEGYAKYVYVLNRTQLRDLHDLVLVDMPGFDSGIEAHNKALMQYISEAAAYVFVIDMTKGAVGQSSLDFLRELKKYSRSVSFVLTKSDKLTPENMVAIKDEIQSVIESVWQEKTTLMVMSIREDDAGKKLARLFGNFSVDDLLMQKHGGNVLFILQQALNLLETQLKALEFNFREIDLAIGHQENQKDAVLFKLKKEEHSLYEDMNINVPARIVGDVEAALRNQISLLVNSAMQGNEAFHCMINNILRPVLIQSTERHIEASFNDYMGVIANFSNKQEFDATEVAEKMKKTVVSVKAITKAGQAFAKAQKFGKLYKLFTTGASVTTSVIAPWMELVIIFLPEILGALNSILGTSRKEKLQRYIEQVAIPQICDKLRPEIKKAMQEIEEEQAEMLKDRFQKALDSEIRALEKLKQEKENQQLDVREKQESLTRGIRDIKAMIVNLENSISTEENQP